MKLGKSAGLSAKLGFDMTPMIDVCFQLIIFFMLSMKINSPEGDFNIKMPLGAVASNQPNIDSPPIIIRLVVGRDGELDGVQVGTRPPLKVTAEKYSALYRDKYPDSEKKAQMAAREAAEDDVFASVRTVVKGLVKRQGGPDSGPGSIDAANQEVEINADAAVKFRCVIKTINTVSGFREGSGKEVVKMIEKIRFSPPKKTAP
jgi:biopolymer transport protein ExbD